MARVKLSEYRAKQLLFEALNIEYNGVSVGLHSNNFHKTIKKLPKNNLYVAKVDQAIKKRGKSGLVALKRTKDELISDLESFAKKGYHHGLAEPYIEHNSKEEHYIAFQQSEKGVELSYSPKGGVEVEANASTIKRSPISDILDDAKEDIIGLDHKLVKTLYDLFQRAHMTLLEINPLIVKNGKYIPLDAAVEVDSASGFFVSGAWGDDDIRESITSQSEAEKVVTELNSKSPASFSLKVLNPNGTYFLLLSGGGASVVVADELSSLVDHRRIANYGEYSGNPSEDETYTYTKEVLRLMFNSKAKKKILVIAGGVANFTDVSKTFAGIIRAIGEDASKMKRQKICVFVRRGGPNQEKGLKDIKDFFEGIGIKHFVYGPEKSLSEVIGQIAEAGK